jgi:2,3-diphosphopglycerate-independent phosphoglycerate mutase
MSTQRHPVVFVLIDGLADVSIDMLRYREERGTTHASQDTSRRMRTTLEEAHTPAMDAVAFAGLNGLLDPVEPAMACGSDTAHMSIFGYDPVKYYRGRGSFEAMGAGLDMDAGDVAYKCNFATIDPSTKIVERRRVDRNFHLWGTSLCPFVNTITLPSFPNVKLVCKYATEHRCGIVFKGPDLTDHITGTDPLKDKYARMRQIYISIYR